MNDLKSHFPFFIGNPHLVYLDSASTAQRVDRALETEQEFYSKYNANVHRGLYPIAEKASEHYEAVRETAQSFIHAPLASSIVFTRGTTEGLNIVAQCWGRANLKKGDEVLLTAMEHHSNLVPWQMVAKETGAVLKFCPLTKKGDLDYEAFEKLLTKKTKMVSITGLSNVLGTFVDLEWVIESAHKVGALVCVDAAQLVAHAPIDVQALDVDFLAFSSHKIYGPTGAGVLYGKREHLDAMNPWMGGGDMIRSVSLESSEWNDVPYKFEAGTPNIAGVIGMGAAMEFLTEQDWKDLQDHEKTLFELLIKELKTLPFVEVYGVQAWPIHRAAVSFNVKGVHAHDVAAILGEQGVCVRAGHHCAMPLHAWLKTPASVRASFGVYNTREDITALIEALKKVEKLFN